MAIEKGETKWIQPLMIDPEEKCPSLVLLTPMDLQVPNMHIPMVLSFPDASSSAEANMEKGLSRVLAHYLEMAGRLGADEGGRPCIHLSNEGVPFVLAKSRRKMDEFLEQGKHDHLDELLASSSLPGTCLPLLVQITRFACGGITLGIERHHRVVDGTGNAKFIFDWASCSKLQESFVPVAVIHDRPWLMPREPRQVEFEHPEYNPPVRMHKVARNSVTNVSVTFDPEELASIKSQCGSSSQQYSTFVSLSALLWRSITAARKLQDDATTHFVCPIDGRRYLGTPAGFFGNAVFRGDPEELASIKSQCGSSSQQYSTFVSLSALLWRSITAARKLQDDATTHFVCPIDGRRYLGTPAGFFVFRGDPEELASIKSQCGSSSQQYSTFVSLSALLWRSITAARKLQDDATTHFVCPIDGRRYLGTPAGFFGNAVFRGFAQSLCRDLLEKPLSHAAALIHAGVKCAAREDRMRSVVNYLSLRQRSSTSSSLTVSPSDDNAILSLAPAMVATSWSRFPLYDADFGFGYPKSLSTTGMWTEGTMHIAPSSRKDGSLEVFATLLKDQVREFLLLLGKQ